MKILESFGALYGVDISLTEPFAMRQKWRRGALFSMSVPRRTNAILYLGGAVGEYRFAGGTFRAERGSVVFLPEGAEYSVLNADCSERDTDAYLVEFHLFDGDTPVTVGTEPMLLSRAADPAFVSLMERTVRAYEAVRRCPTLLRGCVHELIGMLLFAACDEESDKYKTVRRGIRMLEGDLYGERSIAEIARACGISTAHFRRLFHEYAGKSPMSYRTELRLAHAKRLLLTSPLTLDAVSEALGFESAAYFCRIFKKHLGVTPSELRAGKK